MSIFLAACEAKDAMSTFETESTIFKDIVMDKFTDAVVDIDVDFGISVTIDGLKFCFDEDFYSDENSTPSEAEQKILAILND